MRLYARATQNTVSPMFSLFTLGARHLIICALSSEYLLYFLFHHVFCTTLPLLPMKSAALVFGFKEIKLTF